MLLTYGLVPSAFPPHSKWPKEAALLAGWGMFSLPTLWRCTAGAKFVTNIAGEVAVVVSGPKYHK